MITNTFLTEPYRMTLPTDSVSLLIPQPGVMKVPYPPIIPPGASAITPGPSNYINPVLSMPAPLTTDPVNAPAPENTGLPAAPIETIEATQLPLSVNIVTWAKANPVKALGIGAAIFFIAKELLKSNRRK